MTDPTGELPSENGIAYKGESHRLLEAAARAAETRRRVLQSDAYQTQAVTSMYHGLLLEERAGRIAAQNRKDRHAKATSGCYSSKESVSMLQRDVGLCRTYWEHVLRKLIGAGRYGLHNALGNHYGELTTIGADGFYRAVERGMVEDIEKAGEHYAESDGLKSEMYPDAFLKEDAMGRITMLLEFADSGLRTPQRIRHEINRRTMAVSGEHAITEEGRLRKPFRPGHDYDVLHTAIRDTILRYAFLKSQEDARILMPGELSSGRPGLDATYKLALYVLEHADHLLRLDERGQRIEHIHLCTDTVLTEDEGKALESLGQNFGGNRFYVHETIENTLQWHLNS